MNFDSYSIIEQSQNKQMAVFSSEIVKDVAKVVGDYLTLHPLHSMQESKLKILYPFTQDFLNQIGETRTDWPIAPFQDQNNCFVDALWDAISDEHKTKFGNFIPMEYRSVNFSTSNDNILVIQLMKMPNPGAAGQ